MNDTGPVEEIDPFEAAGLAYDAERPKAPIQVIRRRAP